jgi:hypothetical protein
MRLYSECPKRYTLSAKTEGQLSVIDGSHECLPAKFPVLAFWEVLETN